MQVNALRRASSFWFFLTLVFLLALPSPVSAQGGYPPSIIINVSGPVTIYWCVPSDPEQFRPPQLNAGSRQILFNGANVTSSFSYSGASQAGCTYAAVSVATVTSVVGTNTIQATISDMAGRSTTETESWTIPPPPPPLPDHAPAVLNMATNPGDFSDPSKCVMDCFENVFTYSMPSYVSRDVERGVTLVYRSGRAHPIGRVALTVSDASRTLPTSYSLKVRKGDGSFVTFLNGRTELSFQPKAPTALVGEFDVSAMDTRRIKYTAVVTSYWGDGAPPLISTDTASVLVVNEGNSPYGAGIGIAGLQRFQFNPEPEGGLIVTEGAGGASWFSGNCAVTAIGCTYVSPAGDFSTMSVESSGYVRKYPDGTRVTFTMYGYHWQTIDRFGGATSYSYPSWSPSGNCALVGSITDPAGIRTTFGYSDGSNYWRAGTSTGYNRKLGRIAALFSGWIQLTIWWTGSTWMARTSFRATIRATLAHTV